MLQLVEGKISSMAHLSSAVMNNDQYKRAPTKTITFTGGAGAGAINDITLIYTITGRVRVHLITAYCTTLLTESGATATISLGTAGDVDAFIAVTDAVEIDATEWWTGAAPVVGSKSPVKVETGGLVISQVDKLVDENINTRHLVAGTTGGVIVFDCWYEPITSTGALT